VSANRISLIVVVVAAVAIGAVVVLSGSDGEDDAPSGEPRAAEEAPSTDDRRTNIQVQADLEVAFESTHDFPTQSGFRRSGLTAREVNAGAPARLLRGIDRQRRGSAARDVDYVVIGKSIIDGSIGVTAYMRIRTPRPRYFRLEGGQVEAFG
jgi:hypothetical protein